MEVAICGAGNVGCAQAVDLSLRGHNVRLFDVPPFSDRLKVIERDGGISYSGVLGHGKALVSCVFAPEDAVREAEIIFIATPAYGHLSMFEAIRPYIREEQLVIFDSSYFACMRVFQWLKTGGILFKGIFAELEISPYAARLLKDGESVRVDIRGIKKGVGVATLASKNRGHLLEKLQTLYPEEVNLMSNVLETSLNNINVTMHTAIMTGNLGRIKSLYGMPTTEEVYDWGFYEDGLSPAVWRVIEVLDEEKKMLGQALAIKLETSREREKRLYTYIDPTTGEKKEAPPRARKEAPATIMHRYYSEDVPYGLVPIYYLCDAVGIYAVGTLSIIILASIASGVDFLSQGVNLDSLGIRRGLRRDLTKEVIYRIVEGAV
ncbi:MAG: NAD/NADP octopine/nopaline dehydrogenase family protein [Candidatus Hadarchaeum sp.]|uniref:NAD/NADP octopine/nopaline dehydrogenase family protein n=1 Tax=Candidatus Hadarchaeum sp. TaxID=2883567 RepID=UPI00316B6E3C